MPVRLARIATTLSSRRRHARKWLPCDPPADLMDTCQRVLDYLADTDVIQTGIRAGRGCPDDANDYATDFGCNSDAVDITATILAHALPVARGSMASRAQDYAARVRARPPLRAASTAPASAPPAPAHAGQPSAIAGDSVSPDAASALPDASSTDLPAPMEVDESVPLFRLGEDDGADAPARPNADDSGVTIEVDDEEVVEENQGHTASTYRPAEPLALPSATLPDLVLRNRRSLAALLSQRGLVAGFARLRTTALMLDYVPVLCAIMQIENARKDVRLKRRFALSSIAASKSLS
eukprot:m.98146 g.98146  ORF g.98146 m.98146 type:complete len:295 (+) comp8688_c0_seq5:2727-3611(+)